MLLANDTLDHYRLIRPIHASPSGEVWAAENYHQPNHPPVMIKVLASRLFSQSKFFTQADRWKSVNHPNIVPILTTQVSQNQQIVVSEYNPDNLLANWLAQHNGRAPQEQIALDLIRGILTGLAYLHQRQLLHAELNPNNIQIVDNYPQLLNFGQVNARIPVVDSTPIISNFDSLFYLAPEVFAASETVAFPTVASDIWSTGVVLYQLLTGQLPFVGQSRMAVIKKITIERYAPLPATTAKPLSDIIDRALQKDPTARFPSAQEMLEALSAVAPESSHQNAPETPPKKLEKLVLMPGNKLGPYELIANIGQGSFATVWRARKVEGINPEVAIKVLNDHNSNKEMFQKEAQLWVNLGFHPNVMPIIEATIYNDYQVIISAYSNEGSLDSWLKRQNGRAPSEKVAVELITGILQGLVHLHSNKVIHSDLAPKNVLLQGGIPRLIDFGLSKILASNQSTVEGKGGTPLYMAPEVYGGETSKRSDIWSAGVILYQLLAGNLPFLSNRPEVVLRKVLMDAPPPLPNTVSKPLQEIVYRALAKQREQRFASAQAMIDALQAFSTPITATLTISDSQSEASTLAQATNYFNQALAYQKQGKLDQALNNYNECLKLDSHYPMAYYNRGNLKLAQGLLDQAIDDYHQAVMLAPQDALTYYNRGLAYLQKELWPQALSDFKQALHYNPQLPEVYLSQARVYQQQQQWDQAIEACTQAISLDAKNSLAYQLRGDLHRAQKSLDAAIADYHQAILIDSLTATTFIKRGNAYQDKGDITRALEDYRQAITLDPANIAAYLARGTVYYQQKQFSLALADYNQALRQDATCAAAYYNRGNIYAQQNQFDLAIADYSQALQYQPNAQTYSNRGSAYYDKGLIDQAINDYQQALTRDAHYLLAYYNRGIAYQTKGLSELALRDYNYILENLDATYSAAYLKRGDIYRERASEYGNNDQSLLNQAISNYRQALEFEAHNAAAYHGRGLVYQAQNQLKEALADFDQAIKLDPQNAQFYYSRGNAYSSQTQLQPALTDYNKAIALDPKFAHAYYNRGLVYQQLDQKREAILDFQQAKKFHQQPHLIADAAEQLRQLTGA
jgi:serine/threonine protein kinase/cytochrome c-type biogenesis protein CcmH/NrfG